MDRVRAQEARDSAAGLCALDSVFHRTSSLVRIIFQVKRRTIFNSSGWAGRASDIQRHALTGHASGGCRGAASWEALQRTAGVSSAMEIWKCHNKRYHLPAALPSSPMSIFLSFAMGGGQNSQGRVISPVSYSMDSLRSVSFHKMRVTFNWYIIQACKLRFFLILQQLWGREKKILPDREAFEGRSFVNIRSGRVRW